MITDENLQKNEEGAAFVLANPKGFTAVTWDAARAVQELCETVRELRADNDAMAERIQAGDRARDDVIEECAVAARQIDRINYEWVRDSLWDNVTARAAAAVRRLKTKPLN
jgi:outer membrane murein-binding lipoprotein Lpp